MTLTIHTEPPVIREEQFTLPPHREEEYCLDIRAVELMSELKFALDVEPETRLRFADYLQSEAFRTAIRDGRKIVNVEDVLEAYSRIYDS